MLSISELNARATPENLRKHVQAGDLTPDQFQQALVLANYTPKKHQWRSFFDVALLALGVILLVSGVIFFVAFNWQDLHRFVKLGLVELSIIVAVGVALWLGLDRIQGKIVLTGAALLVGGLIALYGQIYQTGADVYQLFLLWTLLISGFVLAGRFSVLWMVWLALANITFAMYSSVHDLKSGTVLLIFFLLNAVAFIAWEYAYHAKVTWVTSRWMARVSACVMLMMLVQAILLMIFETRFVQDDPLLWLMLPISLFVAIAMLYLYSQRRFDGLLLVATAVAVCTCVNAWLLNTLDLHDFTPFVLGFLILGQTAGVITWIRRTARAWEVSRSWQTH